MPERTVAIDIIVNELHWGFPMIKHITQHICNALDMNRGEENEFLALAEKVIGLRKQLAKKKAGEKK